MPKDANHFGKAFGKLVRRKRGMKGWSQETLAEVALRDPARKGMISNLENGRVKAPHQRTIERLAQVLSISEEELEECRSFEGMPPPSRLLFGELGTQNFKTKELWEIQGNLGLALQAHARASGDLESLQQSIEAFRSALALMRREQQPRAWASVQNNLGVALKEYAERSGDANFLREAIEALKQANDALLLTPPQSSEQDS